MGKATQRRERHLANDLQAILTRSSDDFVRVWDLYLQGWCEEVAARGRCLSRGKEEVSIGSVHAILDKAERLLRMIGPDAEREVGARTRQVLSHECCKAIAKATDARLYLFEKGPAYRLMMTRAQPR